MMTMQPQRHEPWSLSISSIFIGKLMLTSCQRSPPFVALAWNLHLWLCFHSSSKRSTLNDPSFHRNHWQPLYWWGIHEEIDAHGMLRKCLLSYTATASSGSATHTDRRRLLEKIYSPIRTEFGVWAIISHEFVADPHCSWANFLSRLGPSVKIILHLCVSSTNGDLWVKW